MIKQIIFKKKKFNNVNSKTFNEYINKNGLFVFPAGPHYQILKNRMNIQVTSKSRLCFF